MSLRKRTNPSVFPVLFVVCLLTAFSAGAEETVPAVSGPPREQVMPDTLALRDAETIIQEARQLMSAGELEEAAGKLEEALAISRRLDTVAATKEAIGKIHTEILFSKKLSPDSDVHEVNPGDNLTKIAKKYNTTVELIMRSNSLQNSLIRPGEKLKVSKAAYSVTVDKSDRKLTLLSNGKFFKEYTVAVGKPDTETPVGSFSIDSKLENPTWFHAGAVVPPDSPENILGTRWLGFSIPGYGIHGTTDPSTLGQSVTSGCIRMANQDVEELYAILPAGAWVTVAE